ncbi:MAG: hypothetical protein IJE07_05625 [Clostridia bacterium]|nr:hypothetical protein [Clostridia bacterium]
MSMRRRINTWDVDLDNLMVEANRTLERFCVGQYWVLRADGEHDVMHESEAYRAGDGWGIGEFRAVFWDKGYYADGNVGMFREPITCLCKVLDVAKAVKNSNGWRFPRLIIENVATHQQFDFCRLTKGDYLFTIPNSMHDYDRYETCIMPYLLTVLWKRTVTKGRFGMRREEFSRSYVGQSTYVGTRLSPCDNDEAAAHLRHIAKVLERERAAQANKPAPVETATLEELYKQLQ